jgi:hypothetical protein
MLAEMGIPMNLINYARRTVFLLLVLLFFVGCGGAKSVKVKGNLQKKGQPLVVNASTIVTLQFIPKDGGNTFSGKIKTEDGSYEANFPPGVYNVLFIMHDTSLKKPIPKPKTLRSNFDFQTDQTLDLEIDS